jgi:hypothetical protein
MISLLWPLLAIDLSAPPHDSAARITRQKIWRPWVIELLVLASPSIPGVLLLIDDGVRRPSSGAMAAGRLRLSHVDSQLISPRDPNVIPMRWGHFAP